ncbi:C163B-like protein, partial [Mya arenaria]
CLSDKAVDTSGISQRAVRYIFVEVPEFSDSAEHPPKNVLSILAAAIDIRLVGGSSQYSGRVEILFDNKWGTVCGDSFSDTDAVVVAGARVIANHASYPTAPAQIWLDDVGCAGSEQSIADCSHRMPWGSHNCNHDDDVGVVCSSTAAINIRLVGGSSQYSGRVEIFINEMIGARVIANHASFPIAPAQIWLDDVGCTGSEQSIADCYHRIPWGSHNCNHDDDVGVVCSSTADINIRLVGGSSQYSGRTGWWLKPVQWTCRDFNQREVGAGARFIANHASYPTAPAQIWLDDVGCTGSEQSIADCYHRMPWGSHNCNHDDDVGVVCSSTAAINIRLVGGSSQYSGRVEILINEKAGARAYTNIANYPTAPAQIWLDDVGCTGSEQSIADCYHRMPWGSHNCNHDDDVGVVCSSTADINIRLVGGSSQYSGRVEILINEKWGTVCDDSFSDTDAVVVAGARVIANHTSYPTTPAEIWLDDVQCTGSEQSIADCYHRIPWGSHNCNHDDDVGVACSSTGARVIANHTSYPTPPAQIWLDDVRCTGSEQSIADCYHRVPWGSHNCNHDDDVGVACSSTAAINIRLVGGTSQYSGRVEILINEKWGTVCGHSFSDKNAVVVAGARAYTNLASYPTAPAQIWLDDVRCTGSEQSIADCYHRM